MNKQERLEKAVVDTEAAWDAAYDAWDAADAWDDITDAEDAAWVALVKAKKKLAEYLKEQDK